MLLPYIILFVPITFLKSNEYLDIQETPIRSNATLNNPRQGLLDSIRKGKDNL